MQPKLFRPVKNLLISPTFLIVFLSMFTLLSCKEKYATNPTCMKLTKAQIDHWVEEGFTSGKDSIAYLQIKTAYPGPGTVFRTFVTGLTITGETVQESLTELKSGDNCSVGLDDSYMLIGSSIFKFPYSKLFENGALKKGIKKIIFVPLIDISSGSRMLNYGVNNQEGLFKLEITELPVPCPPCANCIPPNPPKCTDISKYLNPTEQEPKTDSTQPKIN